MIKKNLSSKWTSWNIHNTKDVKSRTCNMILLRFYFHVNVVVLFYSWFNFYFPLFLCMAMYDNENYTKGNKTWTKDKIEP